MLIQEVVNNKSILVIGNGNRKDTVTKYMHKDTDLSVRFNAGIANQYADIWAPTGMFRGNQIESYKNQGRFQYYYNFHNKYFPSDTTNITVPHDYVDEAKKDLSCHILFSGTHFLWILLNKCTVQDVFIIGINCWRGVPPTNPHSKCREKEEKWMQQMIMDERIIAL